MGMEKLLEAFVCGIPDPVVITDTDHMVLYMNQAAIDLFEGGEALLGKSLFDCHKEESGRIMEEVLERLKAGEVEVQITERQGEDPENRQRTFMRAIRDRDGNLLGYYERYMYWPKRID
ncbi:MAG: PAS domain-containing protein [Candidatus Glassbacteria bacterium]|nr:PAS domain-containing protein [Candidatus Glassbacteria bacterium]